MRPEDRELIRDIIVEEITKAVHFFDKRVKSLERRMDRLEPEPCPGCGCYHDPCHCEDSGKVPSSSITPIKGKNLVK